jgi:hypothetical protein
MVYKNLSSSRLICENIKIRTYKAIILLVGGTIRRQEGIAAWGDS